MILSKMFEINDLKTKEVQDKKDCKDFMGSQITEVMPMLCHSLIHDSTIGTTCLVNLKKPIRLHQPINNIKKPSTSSSTNSTNNV